MRRRLVVSYLALTLVVLAALEIPLGMSYADHQRDELASGLQRDAFVLASFSADTLAGNGAVDLQQLADSYSQRTGGRVVIVDANGDLRADSNPLVQGPRSFADRPEIAEALDRRVATGTRASSTLGTGLLYVAVPVAIGSDVKGAVRITYSTRQVDDKVRRYWVVLFAIGAISLLAAAGVGLLFARWVSRPVEELTRTSTRLGAGDLTARAPTGSGPPEIRELATAFNITAARLEELITAQEHFVADASHQLRTPLTALRLRLEMLEAAVSSGEADEEQSAEDLVAARAEVQRLSRLVDGLLTLARAERASATATAENVELDALLDDRCAAWEPVAAERQVRLVAEHGAVQARATPDRLTQVLDNLIANALEVSPQGGTITLTASPLTGVTPGAQSVPSHELAHHEHERAVTTGVEVRVRDEGPGLPPALREHAFDRFWRAGSSRGELGGSGLGLAIVQKLVHADGGEVELQAAEGGGLSAVVRLPPAR